VQLYNMAAQCYAVGRSDNAVRYADAARAIIGNKEFDPIPYEGEAWLGGVYLSQGRPDRFVEVCRNMVQRDRGHLFARACLALARSTIGADDEALAASAALPTAADATDNPQLASYALLAYGIANRDADPAAAYNAHRKGQKIAQDSGNRQIESYHAGNLSRVAAAQGEHVDALEYVTLALRRFYDSGSFSIVPSALAVLADVLDRLGRYEPAAIFSAAGEHPFARTTYPELQATIAHLRKVLGDKEYESLLSAGESMTNVAMVTYAFEQIDLARADLLRADGSP
jgi:tetratricopeptide (TPR) repeat protein